MKSYVHAFVISWINIEYNQVQDINPLFAAPRVGYVYHRSLTIPRVTSPRVQMTLISQLQYTHVREKSVSSSSCRIFAWVL
jgi:hypothetical protein